MISFLLRILVTLAFWLGLCRAQCPNEVFEYNQIDRTASVNGTYYLVPVPKSAAQDALTFVHGHDLLLRPNVLLADIPDSGFLPPGFDKLTQHLVVVLSGLNAETSQSILEIPYDYLGGSVTMPWVRKRSSAPGVALRANLAAYLTGKGNEYINAIVPGVVSGVALGLKVLPGYHQPSDAAWQRNDGDIYSSSMSFALVDNRISGPGAYPKAFAMQWTRPDGPPKRSVVKLIQIALNLPLILGPPFLAADRCINDKFYFNNETSVPQPANGNVTLYAAAENSINPLSNLGEILDDLLGRPGILQAAAPDGLGHYNNLHGFSACGQSVSSIENMPCDEAYENIDLTALQDPPGLGPE